MLKYKVVLVPFPFDDLSSSKVRPAICLTNAVGTHNHIVLAFITSRIPDKLLPTDFLIETKDDNFEKTGLRVSSTLRLHRMMTATTTLIRRELGQLSFQQQAHIKKRLRKLFDLS